MVGVPYYRNPESSPTWENTLDIFPRNKHFEFKKNVQMALLQTYTYKQISYGTLVDTEGAKDASY